MACNHRASPGESPAGWRPYWDKAGLGAPRPTLLKALDAWRRERGSPGHAIDLGCGVGRDALPLLTAGWTVTAVDREEEALERLCAEAATRGLPPPTTIAAAMEKVELPPARLVNASFSLFFCRPDTFVPLWHRIRRALQPGGRLACQLIGPQDSWRDREGVTIVDAARLAGLLGGYGVDWLEREVSETVTPRGEAKRWDLWHLVLRRP